MITITIVLGKGGGGHPFATDTMLVNIFFARITQLKCIPQRMSFSRKNTQEYCIIEVLKMEQLNILVLYTETALLNSLVI